ncbi:MAG: hypothetical protein J0L92_06875, partial [Deltaproteobacteria bacterium]|nr:hypothetical protein [Deltaproteobacteria bacterium]
MNGAAVALMTSTTQLTPGLPVGAISGAAGAAGALAGRPPVPDVEPDPAALAPAPVPPAGA